MSDRAQELAAMLPGAGADLMLVTTIVNVRYLTGFTGSSGLVVVGPERRAFSSDFRYLEQAADEVDRSFERHQAPRDLVKAISALLPEGHLRLGFEAGHVSVRDWGRLREQLRERVELVALDGVPERLRAVKDAEEVASIRAAATLADAAFERVLDAGLIGRTEAEVALALEVEMRRGGARRPSFETIVASGPHGALPHAQPRDVEIASGQLVVIDWGAELDGYCSDCTRTVAAGEPGSRAREIYELVLHAQHTGLAAVRAGAEGKVVDAAARDVIVSAGHGEHFGHGLGHGVGLEIHEAPSLSQSSDGTLEDGNVVTVEPGVYLPGELGVRIEDLVVARSGGAEILTSIPKALRIAG
jgi:Xaa-Pro aminopeptidase